MTSRLPVFMVSLALASGLAGAEPLRTTVGRTDNAPKVDGRADACYAGAFPVSGFADIGTMAPAPEDTDVRFVHDGTRLYGFVTCEQKDAMKAAPSSPVRGDPNVWTGNSVEFFFWTDDGIRYYTIGQFANCNWLVAHQDDANVWIRNHPAASGFEVATHREDGRWFAEFSIPLSELGGGNLRLNIGRNVPGRQISAGSPSTAMAGGTRTSPTANSVWRTAGWAPRSFPRFRRLIRHGTSRLRSRTPRTRSFTATSTSCRVLT